MGTNILIKKGNLSQIARKMFNIFNDFDDFGLYNRRQRAPTQRRQQCACNECRKTQRIQKRQGQNTNQRKPKLARRKSPTVEKPIRTDNVDATKNPKGNRQTNDRKQVGADANWQQRSMREEPLLVELEHPEFSTVDELVADEEIIIE